MVESLGQDSVRDSPCIYGSPQGQYEYVARASFAEGFCAFIHRRAGGKHVVNEQDAFVRD